MVSLEKEKNSFLFYLFFCFQATFQFDSKSVQTDPNNQHSRSVK